jgi:hypothetical protein
MTDQKRTVEYFQLSVGLAKQISGLSLLLKTIEYCKMSNEEKAKHKKPNQILIDGIINKDQNDLTEYVHSNLKLACEMYCKIMIKAFNLGIIKKISSAEQMWFDNIHPFARSIMLDTMNKRQ